MDKKIHGQNLRSCFHFITAGFFAHYRGVFNLLANLGMYYITEKKNRRSSRFTDSFYTLQCCIAKLLIPWLDLLSNISSGTHLRHGAVILTSKEQSNADDGNFIGKVVQCP